MAIETLKEYLVKIGWNIDEVSFKNANSVIDVDDVLVIPARAFPFFADGAKVHAVAASLRGNGALGQTCPLHIG